LAYGFLRYKDLKRKKEHKKKSYDKSLLYLTIGLTFLGVLAVADASTPQALKFFSDSFYFLRSQIVAVALGFVGLIISSRIHYSVWKRYSVAFFVLTIAMLLLVLIPGVGIKSLGARRWIDLSVVSFQPSEFVKLFFAIYVSSLVSSKKNLLSFVLPLLIVAALVMLQPDMGTTLVILSIGVSAIFVNGISFVSFISILSVGFLAGLLLIFTSTYRRERLMSFLSGVNEPLTSSYHVKQILLGLGLGGFLGSGLGQSRQKFLFLPESATDSVFVVIAEELGFVGAVIVLILISILVFRLFRIALRSEDRFASAFSTCVGVWIGLQSFLNIGSMVVLVPLTGIPLPFFSYGGTSLIALLVSIGIVLNISREGI